MEGGREAGREREEGKRGVDKRKGLPQLSRPVRNLLGRVVYYSWYEK